MFRNMFFQERTCILMKKFIKIILFVLVLTFSFSIPVSAVTRPAKQNIVKISSPKKEQIFLSWKKYSSVKGYQIYISKSSNFSKSAKSLSVGKNTHSLYSKNWKSKTKYYAKVRSFKMAENGKKLYGKWSTVRSVTVK
jgi:hypothetical protein